MADKDKKKKKNSSGLRGGVQSFLTSLFLGANLVTLVLLWACCASTWVNQVYHPNIGVVGLLFPALLLLNLLFVPFWLVFKFRMLVVPLLGMALCGTFILDYCPINWGEAEEDADVTIVSWNTFSMGDNGKNGKAVVDYLQESGADIFCLQESLCNSEVQQMFYKTFTDEGYQIYYDEACVLVSRYPVLSSKRIDAPSYARNGVSAYELLMGEDTITVFNGHLECNRLTVAEKNDYEDVLRSPESTKIKGEARYLAGRLARAAGYRACQVQAFLTYLDSVPEGRPTFFCADFNDTPISYAYQQVKRRMNCAYRAKGKGIGLTYRERHFPIRIDHVFFSDEWECCEARVDRSIDVSDHFPVVVKLKKRSK